MPRLRNVLCLLGLCLSLSSFALSPLARADCPAGDGQILLKGSLAPEQGLEVDWEAFQTATQLSVSLPLQILQDSVTNSPKGGEVVLHTLDFDAKQLQYLFQVTLVQWPFWDQVQFVLDFPTASTLRLQLKDNWLPTELVMPRLEHKLRSALSLLPMDVQRQGSILNLHVQKQPLQLPLGLSTEPVGVDAEITSQGDLKLRLAASESVPSDETGNPPQSDSNLAAFETETCISGLDGVQGEIKGQIGLVLKPADVAGVVLGSEKLAERIQAGVGRFAIQGTFSGSLLPFDVEAEGLLQMAFEQLEVEGEIYKDIQSVPFRWRYSSPAGFKIYPEFTHQSIPAEFSKNNLKLFIDGPDYFQELKKVLREARESIDQEIFSFYDGETTREIARIMMLKAMGLREQRQGELEVDLFAPNGARVFLMHNHKLTRLGAEEVVAIFAQTSASLLQELIAAEMPIAIYQKRLEQNFRIAPLAKGVIKTDHRKMLVIDGTIAYVGGLNMADHYLSSDGFHDLMIRVQGPLVRRMHDEFIENWEQISPEKVVWNQKDPQALKLGLLGLKTSSVAVVTTDDDSPESIEASLLELIASAQDVIRMEHAYIYHEPIEAALRAALQRGVRLEIVFSEQNDEPIFEMLNPASVHDLMQFAPDQVKVWLYQGKGGEYGYMSHTKYLSVDGKAAIVGSANLIPRSLHSPFWSQGKPLLFNEEMSLYIQDENFVSLLDKNLLEFDIKRHSRQVSLKDLEQLIQRRGGANKLFLERLKGLLT